MVGRGTGGSGGGGDKGGTSGTFAGGTGGTGTGGTGGVVSSGGTGTGGSGGTPSGLIDYHYGDVTPCDTAKSSIFFDGEGGDYIHPGQDLITVAHFTDSSSSAHVSFDIEPSGEEHGLWWWVDFSTEELGEPIKLGEYLDAERYPFQTYLKPGMDVSGDGRGCNQLSGKFLVTDIAWVGGTLLHFTAAFEQHCEEGNAALRGCVHYDSGLPAAGGTGGAGNDTGGASNAGESGAAG
jgi:hypothetical protein